MAGPGTVHTSPNSFGVTPSERYLSQLARRSFLSLWSYSNLYTDENRKGENGVGSELCDLLVVFDKHVIIFSDKHCAFQSINDNSVAWKRWYKRAIYKSAKQLIGAESWIRRFPKRIYLDSKCQNIFPIPLPESSTLIFHRLAVTRGAYEKCKSYFGGGSTGSLFIDTSIKGDEHLNNPFHVGRVTPEHGYTHVLDELTLEVLLREMDTISDFIDYLGKKEQLLMRPNLTVSAAGEEQLIAMYLTNMNQKNEHDFVEVPNDVNAYSVDEGFWEEYVVNPQYKAKKKADEISYNWDSLIEYIARNSRIPVVEGQLTDIKDIEHCLRVMAAEPRLRRRQLATSLLDAMRQPIATNGRFLRLHYSTDFPDTVYVYLILPRPTYVSTTQEYRRGRTGLLSACCEVAILKAPYAKRILGIATEPMRTYGATEDVALLEREGDSWTQAQLDAARKLQAETDIFNEHRIKQYAGRDNEYPEIERSPHESVGHVSAKKARKRRSAQQAKSRKQNRKKR